MEPLFIYLIKSTTLLALFFSSYYFLLKNTTFFSTNRWFLLTGIFISGFLPLLTFEKTVWVEATKNTVQIFNSTGIETAVSTVSLEESSFFSWELVVGFIYLIGILFFLSQLIVELYSLRKIIENKVKTTANGFEFIEVNEAISPFSFFKKIVYNPSIFQPEELENIIEHEKIHATQLHSVDVLITRIYCIIFWWNPLVWLYKKAITQNLEFIADQNALAKAKDKKSYLLTLLKITTSEKQVAITNHFYQSLIKKRIVMLNTNQSKKHHSWKYFVVLPALVFFMFMYQVEVVAQVKPHKESEIQVNSEKVELKLDANSSDTDFKAVAKFFFESYKIKLSLKSISRNKKGEIKSIKINLSDDKGQVKIYDVSSDEAIKPFNVFIDKDDDNNVDFGFEVVNNTTSNQQNVASKLNSENKDTGLTKFSRSSTTYSIKINSNSTKKEIDEQIKFFKKDFGIKIKFSGISRNKNEEIKSISVKVSDKKGQVKIYDVSGNDPIKPFNIFVTKDDSNATTFGFSATNENQHLKNHYEAISQLKNAAEKKEIVVDDVKTETLNNGYEMSFKTSSSSDNISLIKEDKNTDYKKAYISLNGKEISITEMEGIDPNKIGSVTMLNSGNNDKLVAKFGEKARNGAIIIETMDFEEVLTVDKVTELSKKFKLDSKNGSFVIHKRSQQSDFDFYGKQLEEIGIKLKLSDLKRNKEGFITSIKIKLVDKEHGHKMSANWETSKNSSGIPDINIGRNKGKLVLSAK